jgi:hypothetical protein
VGACAIYTAIPDATVVEDMLACFDDDIRAEDDKVAARGWHRFGLGRLQVMALAEAVMPASHRELARVLRAKSFYGSFAPAAAHQPGFIEDIQRYVAIAIAPPLWPASPALAGIIGCAPGRYHGWHEHSTHGVAMLEPDVLDASVAELAAHDLTSVSDDEILGTRNFAVRLIEWLTAARDRGDCVVLHWEQR